MVKRIKCPCCGNYTIESNTEVIVEICEVCGWQYDLTGQENPDIVIGPNHVSLNEAQKNYRLFQVSDRNFLNKNWLRKPMKEELPENNE